MNYMTHKKTLLSFYDYIKRIFPQYDFSFTNNSLFTIHPTHDLEQYISFYLDMNYKDSNLIIEVDTHYDESSQEQLLSLQECESFFFNHLTQFLESKKENLFITTNSSFWNQNNENKLISFIGIGDKAKKIVSILSCLPLEQFTTFQFRFSGETVVLPALVIKPNIDSGSVELFYQNPNDAGWKLYNFHTIEEANGFCQEQQKEYKDIQTIQSIIQSRLQETYHTQERFTIKKEVRHGDWSYMLIVNNLPDIRLSSRKDKMIEEVFTFFKTKYAQEKIQQTIFQTFYALDPYSFRSGTFLYFLGERYVFQHTFQYINDNYLMHLSFEHVDNPITSFSFHGKTDRICSEIKKELQKYFKVKKLQRLFSENAHRKKVAFQIKGNIDLDFHILNQKPMNKVEDEIQTYYVKEYGKTCPDLQRSPFFSLQTESFHMSYEGNMHKILVQTKQPKKE